MPSWTKKASKQAQDIDLKHNIWASSRKFNSLEILFARFREVHLSIFSTCLPELFLT